ncbi:MAG: LysM peptidoglycan-binding domain-containing protein, partial [Steroidobacterales bacterium]
LGCCLSPLLLPAVRADSPFVHPAELEPDIQFWTRIYTKVTTNGGLIHDDRYLGVVYEELTLNPADSPRQRQRRVEDIRDHYAAVLRRLITVPEANWNAEDKRVRALWPAQASSRDLAAAADHVRFQLGQSDRFREGLVRSGEWEAHIADTLATLGLPKEIAALPHVESSFNTAAYSKVGAAGMWQFMRYTGRRFMRIDAVVDERMDPFKSTVGAAQLLQYNYQLLGSWPLAITAYNHGAEGMRRAKATMGTDDIVTIVRKYQSRTFGFASRNFYVCFLAALDVDSNPDKYFGSVTRRPQVRSHTIVLDHYMPANAIEAAIGVDRGIMRMLNPSLLGSVWNGSRFVPRGFELRVPDSGAPFDAAAVLARVPAQQRYTVQRSDPTYRVRKGETLAAIARARGTSVQELARLNGLEPTQSLTRGQVLRLPQPSPIAVAAAQPAPEKPELMEVYVVRRGDALSEIARRVGIPEAELMRINGMRDRDYLYEGQQLRVAAGTPAKPVTPSTPVTPTPPTPTGVITVAQLPSPLPEDVVRSETVSEAEVARQQAEQPVSAAQAAEIGPSLVPGGESTATADPSDYSVAADGTIMVQGAETLGHYADWLGVRAQRLRDLNNMRYRKPVVIGRRLKLDFSAVDAATFEQRRRAYQQALQETFFEQFRITGTETHTVKVGESLWTITQRRANLPIWLVRQYNPDVDFEDVRPGNRINIPLIAPSGSATESQ